MNYQTSCRDCCFAVYRGAVQEDCAFGRVEQFRGRGVEVEEVRDESGEKEFFLVKGLCLLHRSRKGAWAMQTPARERKEKARREVSLRTHAVVLLSEGQGLSLAKATADGLCRGPLAPAEGTLVVQRPGVTAKEALAALPSGWKVLFLLERGPGGERPGRGRCVDAALAGSKCDLYAFAHAGFAFPEDFLRVLDEAANDLLLPFVMVRGDGEGNGLAVRMACHSYYGGNALAVIVSEDAGGEAGLRADSVEEKILHRARAEGKLHLVKTWEEVLAATKSRQSPASTEVSTRGAACA